MVRVAYDGKPRYVFPTADCSLLPVPNTTVEMLAELLTSRLHAELEQRGAPGRTLPVPSQQQGRERVRGLGVVQQQALEGRRVALGHALNADKFAARPGRETADLRAASSSTPAATRHHGSTI